MSRLIWIYSARSFNYCCVWSFMGWLTLCMLGNICILAVSWFFFLLFFFYKKLFECQQCVKQFGSRSRACSSRLIWVQTIYKGNRKNTLAIKELKKILHKVSIKLYLVGSKQISLIKPFLSAAIGSKLMKSLLQVLSIFFFILLIFQILYYF